MKCFWMIIISKRDVSSWNWYTICKPLMFRTYESDVKCETCGCDCCVDFASEIASYRRELEYAKSRWIGVNSTLVSSCKTCDDATRTRYRMWIICRKWGGECLKAIKNNNEKWAKYERLEISKKGHVKYFIRSD